MGGLPDTKPQPAYSFMDAPIVEQPPFPPPPSYESDAAPPPPPPPPAGPFQGPPQGPPPHPTGPASPKAPPAGPTFSGRPAGTTPPQGQEGSPVLAIGIVVGLLVVGAGGYFGYKHFRKPLPAPAEATVPVDITTTPAGAAVTVSGPGAANQTCTSNCKLDLTPGTYQVSATLEGYESAAGVVAVVAKQPAGTSLTLQPQAQSLRLLTDLDQGKVTVDGQPPVDLQEGQLVLDKLAPGSHTVKVAGPKGDASFSFQVADVQLPAVTGPVTAHNMVAVLVASFGHKARVVTNAGPWKLAVNGQPQGDATPAGTDITGFQPGVNEIVVGDGADRRNMSESFGAPPMLTAFLKTDVNAGTLIVSTGQDDVRVFLNDKEYRRRTQRGELRIPTWQVLGAGGQERLPGRAREDRRAEEGRRSARAVQPETAAAIRLAGDSRRGGWNPGSGRSERLGHGGSGRNLPHRLYPTRRSHR